VYEKVTKLLDYRGQVHVFSFFKPGAAARKKKLVDEIMPFLKNWHYF
jgi:hypothetical protein